MATFKANDIKRGKDTGKRAKASIRYIQHRRGKDGEKTCLPTGKITRTLLSGYGPMDRQEAYRMINEAWPRCVIVNAVKGELYHSTAGYRKTLGSVFVIDPQGLRNHIDPRTTMMPKIKKLIAEWEALFPVEEPRLRKEGKAK